MDKESNEKKKEKTAEGSAKSECNIWTSRHNTFAVDLIPLVVQMSSKEGESLKSDNSSSEVKLVRSAEIARQDNARRDMD